jgi:transposase
MPPCKRRLKKSLAPRFAEAPSGEHAVFFIDAAHVVFAPFWGIVWCFTRLFVKAPSGRQRLHVLAALNAISHELVTVEHLTDMTAESVCELLRLVAGVQQGVPSTLLLDNARYQRCALVQAVAQELGLERLYWPTYSPDLHLIERLWRFVKKQCLHAKYYPDAASFQQAIFACIQQAPTQHTEELNQLLTLRFQTF